MKIKHIPYPLLVRDITKTDRLVLGWTQGSVSLFYRIASRDVHVLHIWNIFRYRLAAYVFCTTFYEKTPHHWIIPLTVFALNQKVGAIYLVYSLLWMGVTDNTQRIPIVWTPHISLNYSLCCISQKCAYASCFSCFFYRYGLCTHKLHWIKKNAWT